MDKKNPALKSLKEKPKTDIIKRNINNVKSLRNKSKENPKVKEQVKTRTVSQDPKGKKPVAVEKVYKEADLNAIKSPMQPVKSSQGKGSSQASAVLALVEPQVPVQDHVEVEAEHVEAKISQSPLRIEENEVEKPAEDLIRPIEKDTEKNDNSCESPERPVNPIIVPSSLKRRRPSTDSSESMQKTFKISL